MKRAAAGYPAAALIVRRQRLVYASFRLVAAALPRSIATS